MTLLAVALDTAETDRALRWAARLGPHVDVVKVGLELFVAAGPSVVPAVADAAQRPVFLDLKLDDIPRTVAGAARQAARLGASWLTVHTGAGVRACAAAVDAVSEATDPPVVLGVTLLTSLDRRDLRDVGLADDVEGVVDRRARLAAAAGMDGVVCAGGDQQVVEKAAPALLRVIPAIRSPGEDAHDQARVVSAAEAAQGGAAMVVVGRAATCAADGIEVLVAIRAQLAPSIG